MKQKPFVRLSAAALSLILFTLPAAQALTVQQAAELLNELYVDEVPSSVLEMPTIQEMLDALGDPYTQYFTSEEYNEFNASMSDTSLVGIGVAAFYTEEGLLLDRVYEDSPAEKGGLQQGDLIIKVDGQSVVGMDQNAAFALIRGEDGSKVKITYLRDDVRKTVTLTRALVVVPATTTDLIDGHIGYISCTTFGEETLSHFQEGLEKYEAEADGWIVDLRGNTGGVTQAAVDAAGCFTGPGIQAYLRDGADEYDTYVSTMESLTIFPVIVLMDEDSASASELFAAAIQQRGAGIVIGTRSFGKGVAQSVLDQSYLPEYFPDGDAIKITSHRFFTPHGSSTDQVGVIPNLLLPSEQISTVALLLSSPVPTDDTTGILRLDLGWQWFIDLKTASEAYPQGLQTLLEAIPLGAELYIGTGDSDGWSRADVSQVAEEYAPDYHPPVFPDQADSAFPTAISLLKTYELIHGKEDGLFHPQDLLTRAELCQMLATALNCMAPENESPYDDVANDTWYAPAVIAMTNMGLVNGIGNGEFRPEDTIDHQQLITIMGRLGRRLNLVLYDDAKAMPDDALNIAGLSGYSDWARPSAWLLSYSQAEYIGENYSLLWDSAENIDPTATTTRDEAACALYRLLSYIDVLLV